MADGRHRERPPSWKWFCQSVAVFQSKMIRFIFSFAIF